jgi:glycosyltransferase involved in cell wall biosynthesis
MIGKFFDLKFEVMEPGIVPFDSLPKTKSDNLRFGYLGTFVAQKGFVPLIEAFKKVRAVHPTVQLRMYGERAPKGQPPDGITIGGSYSADDLPRILSEIDVGVIPSIFPETFCIVLSEMWHANVPATVSNLGALAERVVDGKNGLKFEPGNVDDIARALGWFVEHDDWRAWQLPRARTLDELAIDHDRLYRSLL